MKSTEFTQVILSMERSSKIVKFAFEETEACISVKTNRFSCLHRLSSIEGIPLGVTLEVYGKCTGCYELRHILGACSSTAVSDVVQLCMGDETYMEVRIHLADV